MRTFGLVWVFAFGLCVCACGDGSEAVQADPPPPEGTTGLETANGTANGGGTENETGGATEEPRHVEPPEEPAAEYPTLVGVPVADDENPEPGVVEVNLVAAETQVELMDGVKTFMWTYNGQFPGPTIQAKVGDRVIVHLQNDLSIPTTIHWHGLRVPNAMDGTPRTQVPIQPGDSFTYDFIVQDAGTFWYHPHAQTRIAVESGLYGAFVVHEAEAPVYDVERIVFLDDLLLAENGQRAPHTMNHGASVHGRNGNVLLVNGQVVEGDELLQLRRGSVERWRILQSANARVADIDLTGATWRVIGWDGGLIPQPYETAQLKVAPGERYDLEVRWNPEEIGAVGELRWWVPTQTATGEVELAPMTLATLMSTGQPALEPHDVALPEGVALPIINPADEATLTLDFAGMMTPSGIADWTINGKTYEDAEPYHFDLDSVHTIDLVNEQGQEHTFHIHGHFFRVVSRNGFMESYTGLKDTVYVSGEEIVRIAVVFDNPGGWMAHCHMLEHADLGMMSLFEVGGAPR